MARHVRRRQPTVSVLRYDSSRELVALALHCLDRRFLRIELAEEPLIVVGRRRDGFHGFANARLLRRDLGNARRANVHVVLRLDHRLLEANRLRCAFESISPLVARIPYTTRHAATPCHTTDTR
jgi:hypothetical protein